MAATTKIFGIILVFSVLELCSSIGPFPPLIDRYNMTLPGMGDMTGLIRKTISDREFYAFLGVPFGKPPVGAKRFKAPEMVDPWNNTATPLLDATFYGKRCVQSCHDNSTRRYKFWQNIHNFFGDYSTLPVEEVPDDLDSEDCLFLHVYTPTLDENANLPVMVFYHGGSFEYGSAMPYLPDYFLDHDVVLVVPHYRLGAVGLVSMQNDEIPGNAAMLDQVLALKWVNKFIKYYGGNPDSVTAFGESAGAASVSLLALSPLTREPTKLIHRIIAESGAAITEWAIDRDPVFNARGIAKHANCDTTSDETITECFMNANVCDLLEAQDRWSNEERKRGMSGFGGCSPVIQTTGEIFIDRDPMRYWDDPDFEVVPSIYGSNKHEGTYVVALVYDDYLRPNGLLDDQNFMQYDIIQPFFIMFGISDNSYLVSDGVEYEYIGIDRMGNFTAMSPGLIDFGGAVYLKAPGYESTIKHSKHAKTGKSYQYSYNYQGPVTAVICSGVVGSEYPFPSGVCHAAEVLMLFGTNVIYSLYNDFEKQLSKQMVEMWYKFAKYGDPTPDSDPVAGVPKWEPYDEINEYYLRIDKEYTLMQDFRKNEYTIAKEEDFFKPYLNVPEFP